MADFESQVWPNLFPKITCNYFLKFKILWWPYYIFPSHYLFGTSSRWYPKGNLQKPYKLKYPSWTLQSPFIFPVYTWNTNTFENLPTLNHTKKKKSSLQIDDICIWVTSTSSFFFGTHVEELVFVQLVWPIPPRNKMTYESHHKDKWKASVQPLSNEIKL
jgi:hypothetical protein